MLYEIPNPLLLKSKIVINLNIQINHDKNEDKKFNNNGTFGSSDNRDCSYTLIF